VSTNTARRALTPPFEIIEAEPKHAEELSRFCARLFDQTFTSQNAPQNVAHYIAANFTPKLQAAEIADPWRRFLILRNAEGVWLGYALLRRGDAPVEVPGEQRVELVRFYIEAEWHGKGMAQKLMDACVAHAKWWRANTLWLGVWEQNPRAIAFYRKYQLEVVGSQSFRMGNDVQRDHIMARSFAPPNGLRR
jgi:GNAT superfamily N-acetyltransferase